MVKNKKKRIFFLYIPKGSILFNSVRSINDWNDQYYKKDGLDKNKISAKSSIDHIKHYSMYVYA